MSANETSANDVKVDRENMPQVHDIFQTEQFAHELKYAKHFAQNSSLIHQVRKRRKTKVSHMFRPT